MPGMNGTQNNMKLYTFCLVVILSSLCIGSDSQSEEIFRGEHISTLLSIQNGESAFEMSVFYEERVFRPEAAFYWASVAFKLGCLKVDAGKLTMLKSKIFEPNFTKGQIKLLPMAAQSSDFLKLRSHLVGKAAKGDLTAIKKLRNIYLIDGGFTEEVYFWSAEEDLKTNMKSKNLESCERAIYSSGVGTEYQAILSEMVRLEDSFWKRLKK